MTARVSVMSGSAGGIASYYGEQIGGYYGDGGPGAFWLGHGAEVLGLAGTPTKSQIRALMDAKHPETGEKLGRVFSTKTDSKRPSARGYDLTFTVPKDVSVLWALTNAKLRGEIEEAVNAAAVATLERLNANAPLRTKGELVPSVGIAAAVIPEHTSRAGDPSLHVHCLISSKVQHPETGKWYALDARELLLHQQASSALFHRALEAELSTRIGVGWGTRNPESRGFTTPLAGANQAVCEALSQRTAAVEARTAHKMERFRVAFDREPTGNERYDIEREAACESRPAKTEIDETEGRRRWRKVAVDITGTGTSYTQALARHRSEPIPLTNEILNTAVRAAIDELSESRSVWRRGHLVTEIARHLPPGLNVTASRLVGVVDKAADDVVASRQIVSVSTSEYTPAAGMVDPMATYTTAAVLEEEIKVTTWFDQALAGDTEVPADIGDYTDRALSEGQTQAAARAAGTGRVELVVGPAGTGKTTALKTAVASLTAQGRAVYGLAPSASAATVLGTETGCGADNVTKFLWEHLERKNGASPEFQLPHGATLIVDEAGMVSTRQWAQLTALAEERSWRIVAVGDGFQFSAVGRGGLFDMLTRTAPDGRVTQLNKVHRFQNEWEAEASLALRQGNPDVIDTYLEHGRIVHSPTDKAAIAAAANQWLALSDQADVAVFAPSNTTVAAINAETQKRLYKQERVTDLIKLGKTKTAKRFGIGDIVVTRDNNRDLVTDLGHSVHNRDRWTITGHDLKAQTITLKGTSGTVAIPMDYAAKWLELGYAQTSHASQGRTVDKSILVIGTEDIVDRPAIYVPLTRGRETNHVIVAGTHNPTEAADRITTGINNRWIDSPAITHITTTPEPTLAELIAGAVQRFAETEQQHKQATRARDEAKRQQTAASGRWARRLAVAQQAVDAAEQAATNHRRPLRVTKKWKTRQAELEAVIDQTRTDLAGLQSSRDRELAPLRRALTRTTTSTQTAATAMAKAGRTLEELRQQNVTGPVAGKGQPDAGIEF